eukprot:TRINITY_DN5289_c0_g1_i1.p1 TRINITY_DN5289_c0_g1~~TRINITY_DN5289_c0_g1_i1.p1  ORF type:complete len:777 (+),score=236.41 TRINITY_DN5289_c0_g1_i1:10-2340(+)
MFLSRSVGASVALSRATSSLVRSRGPGPARMTLVAPKVSPTSRLFTMKRFYSDIPKGMEGFGKSSSKETKSEPEKEEKKEDSKKEGKKAGDMEDDLKKQMEAYFDKMSSGGSGGRKGSGAPESEGGPSLGRVLAVLIAISAVLVLMDQEVAKEITYVQFQNELLASHYVDHLNVKKSKKIVNIYLKPALGESPQAPYSMTIGDLDVFEADIRESYEMLGLTEDDVPITYSSSPNITHLVIHTLPTVMFIVALGYALVGLVKGMPSGGGAAGIFKIGQSKAKLFDGKNAVKVSFKDVAGCEEAKAEVSEFVSFLKNPKRYTALGAKIPKGAALIGPPGTGKTLLAKAVAGEANVPFYSVSGSDFIEVFGGVGASRVRDLFAQARRNTPCIVFVDEIDAIGRKRGAAGSGRNDERENTLNQLLVEMDGFESNQGIVVLCGTNRVDILDPALLRPGRFDRQISIDLPDVKAREAVFKVHLGGIKTDEDEDKLALRLSHLTPGFSGADIANICNEAALIAARHHATVVELKHFEAAVDRVIAGIEKKNKVLNPEEKKRVAYHEAGHATVGWLLTHTDPVLKVSIIPRGQAALGFAMSLPEERYIHNVAYLHERLCVLLAGRVAEEEFFGNVSSGAQDDLEKVTDLAYGFVVKYGMSSLGNISYSDNAGREYMGKPYSEETAIKVDAEVKQLVDQMYEKTRELVKERRVDLETIAKELLAKEVISGDDVAKVLGPKPVLEMSELPSSERALKKKEKESQAKVEEVKDVEVKADAGEKSAEL